MCVCVCVGVCVIVYKTRTVLSCTGTSSTVFYVSVCLFSWLVTGCLCVGKFSTRVQQDEVCYDSLSCWRKLDAMELQGPS